VFVPSDCFQRVFSVLARHGRQTLAALRKASYLNGRQIKHGLVVLIQQHLIFHSATIEPGPTSYEIDWQSSYGLVRYGRALKSVEERFGEKAANVMSNLITLGHTRVQDLREAYFPSSVKDEDDSDAEGINGVSGNSSSNGSLFVNGGTETNGYMNGSGPPKTNGVKRRRPDDEEEESYDAEGHGRIIKSIAELDNIIYSLMMEGWIMKVEWTQYLGPGDLHGIARHEAIQMFNEGRPPTGTKEKDAVALGILRRKREIRDEWLNVPKPATRKRTAADGDLNRSNKRMRIGSEREWAARADEIVVLKDDLTVRVNPEKVTVALRTDVLTRLVRHLLGYVPSKIYEAMLRQIETNTARCYDEWADPLPNDPSIETNREIDPRFLVSAREVAKSIDPTVDLFEGLDPHAIVKLSLSTSHVDRKGFIDPPIDPSSMSIDAKTRVVDKHIRTLSDHPFHFVTWHSRAGLSQWHIEFEEIAQAMIQHEIETTIAAGTERDRKYGVKLVRALKKKGKLDERQMGNVMMMPAAEIRSVVNGLTVRGFVQTQEIPKVERREAKHSIHLIWFDRQRAREKLLHETYKGMVRTLQRLAAERSDVKGEEEKWLSQMELGELRRWKGIQDKLLLQLFRMDEVVAVLRDFLGPLTSV
jgi:DNA-directed RNA polymerase III subunit RPC3